ncbi:MAG: hypothetical protein ACXV5N_10795 [Halobacteriota archaeon]
MNIDTVTAKLRTLGLTIPPGTLRRWAAEGLINAPARVQNPKGRGRLSDWPDSVVEEAAACWVLRHLDMRWAKPTVENIKRVRSLVPQLYETPVGLWKHGVLPDGRRGMFLFSYELHPLAISWAVTVEKVRHNWRILKPARVTFSWTVEGTPRDKTLKLTLVDVTLAEADRDFLEVHSTRTDVDQLRAHN